MPRKKKRDWPEITPIKKAEVPKELPIYINGDIDVTCKFCKGRVQRSGLKYHLFFCTNEEVVKEIKSGFIMSCEQCGHRE